MGSVVGSFWMALKCENNCISHINPESWFFSYAIPNHELLSKACLAASPTPTPQKKRLIEIFSISGGKLEDVLSVCLD